MSFTILLCFSNLIWKKKKRKKTTYFWLICITFLKVTALLDNFVTQKVKLKVKLSNKRSYFHLPGFKKCNHTPCMLERGKNQENQDEKKRKMKGQPLISKHYHLIEKEITSTSRIHPILSLNKNKIGYVYQDRQCLSHYNLVKKRWDFFLCVLSFFIFVCNASNCCFELSRGVFFFTVFVFNGQDTS